MAHTADKDDWSHRFDQILQISELAISKYSLGNETHLHKNVNVIAIKKQYCLPLLRVYKIMIAKLQCTMLKTQKKLYSFTVSHSVRGYNLAR